MSELTLSVLGKAFMRNSPCLFLRAASDDTNSDSHFPGRLFALALVFLRRFWILHGHGAHSPRGLLARFRRPGHEDPWHEVFWERRRQFQFVDLVEFALEGDGSSGKKPCDDLCVFNQAFVSF